MPPATGDGQTLDGITAQKVKQMDIIGIIVGIIGLILAIWSIWYARVQARKVAGIHRSEMISLWATLDRTRTLLMQIQRITSDQGFVESGELTGRHKQILPQIFKGLCDEYVRIAEFIVRKSPGLTTEIVHTWKEAGRLKTDWQEEQFLNLIAAANKQREVDGTVSPVNSDNEGKV